MFVFLRKIDFMRISNLEGKNRKWKALENYHFLSPIPIQAVWWTSTEIRLETEVWESNSGEHWRNHLDWILWFLVYFWGRGKRIKISFKKISLKGVPIFLQDYRHRRMSFWKNPKFVSKSLTELILWEQLNNFSFILLQ